METNREQTPPKYSIEDLERLFGISRVFLAKCKEEGIPFDYIFENRRTINELVNKMAVEFKSRYIYDRRIFFETELDYTLSVSEMATKYKIKLGENIDYNKTFDRRIGRIKKHMVLLPYEQAMHSGPVDKIIENYFPGQIESAGIEHLLQLNLKGEESKMIIAPRDVFHILNKDWKLSRFPVLYQKNYSSKSNNKNNKPNYSIDYLSINDIKNAKLLGVIK